MGRLLFGVSAGWILNYCLQDNALIEPESGSGSVPQTEFIDRDPFSKIYCDSVPVAISSS